MDSKYFTYDLLSYEVEDLDKQTTLKIAFKAKFGAFFYSDLLSNLWREDVETDSKHKHIPLMLSVACPLLAPKLLEIYPDYDEFEWVEDRLPGACWDFVNYSREVTTFLRAPFVKFYYSFFIGDRADYKSNEWNYFDIGALTLYITGFTLRMIYHRDPTICPECLYVARIILAFSLLIFFGRTLQFLSAYESLGPKIYMLYGLVADLFGFLLILGVFVSAYGVVSNVILYPNQPLNATLLSDVFYDSWWSVIQQFNREDALGLNCNMNNASALITAEYCSSTSDDNIDYVLCKENRCPSHKWIVSVLLAFYALLTCIMLLNLLIAMFNSTFTTIDEKEKEVSNIQRYRLISEFRSHSMIPPPLCVVTYPYLIIKHVANQCKSTAKCRCATDGNNSEDSVSTLDDAIKDWECSLAAEYFKENHEGSYETRIFPESTEEF